MTELETGVDTEGAATGNPTRRSRLIVLAGPTAVGKGTVAADIRAKHPEVWISVSATTRRPRPGEENGVHYWFVSDEEFDRMIAEDDQARAVLSHARRTRARARPPAWCRARGPGGSRRCRGAP